MFAGALPGAVFTASSPPPNGGSPRPPNCLYPSRPAAVPWTSMNWSNRSARPRPARTLLLVVLALLAGSFVGTFFIDGGSAEPVPSTQTPAGVTAEGAGAGILPTPVTLANASSSAPRTAENTALPGVATPAVHSVTLGAVAPDFTLPDLFDVETTYTLSTYQGQPVILNFWASWCVPCRREMPALQQTAARYKADGLVLLGMNQTYLDTLSEARAFVEDRLLFRLAGGRIMVGASAGARLF
nr:cytochrome C biogenesis protein [uncultured bacterium]